jgi:putative sigma-54 modulation protein
VQLQVKGRNLQITDALFEHAERKLSKLSRVLPPWDEATKVELELSVAHTRSHGDEQVAEVTVFTKGALLRVRETGTDMYNAIDHAARKLERQAARYRDRRKKRHRHAEPFDAIADEALAAEQEAEAADEGPVIVRNKRFEMKPMAPEDATMQMELLDHDFYVFRSAESGELNVVYRRRDGNYGLIAPD